MKTKKILAILLAIMMLCSIMSITAFADGDDPPPPVYYTVTIYFETVSRAPDQSFDPNTDQTVLNNGNPVAVSVVSGSSLKAAVLSAIQTYPTIVSSPEWTADGQYLTKLTVGTTSYENDDNFYYDPDTGLNTYIGESWMYFVGAPSAIPSTTYIYPSVSLLNATVTSNVTITLSFESQTFVW